MEEECHTLGKENIVSSDVSKMGVERKVLKLRTFKFNSPSPLLLSFILLISITEDWVLE